MNNKISNPLLKQLISEIAGKANQGRITNLSWGSLYESKNILKKEADEKGKPAPKDDAEKPEGDLGGLPPLGGPDEKPADKQNQDTGKEPAASAGKLSAPAADKNVTSDTDAKSADASPDAGKEDAEKAQADATKAKAELEKAKAEKQQAEKELEQQSYIKLKSSGGTKYLLGKLLNQAFKTNTIDALASDMAQKLRITTTDDAASFEKDMAVYKTIQGMADLIDSMKKIAIEKPKKSADEKPAAEEPSK